MTRLQPSRSIIAFRLPEGLEKETNACGLNSLIVMLDAIDPNHKITVDELKQIFDQTHEGISYEKNRFHRLNTLLRERGIPYLFAVRNYASLDDLYARLDRDQNGVQIPLPVLFNMRILWIIKEQFKIKWEINWGDVFQATNEHILLLTGYDDEKEELYFIDPSYQLPFIDQSDKDLTLHYIKVNKKDFYKNVEGLNAAICGEYQKRLAKKYSKDKKNTQQRLDK